ncbi:MAG: hypothetical protein K6G18_11670 [Treponema sp.]|nr:hypothetical protein [Treponema sp.]
MGGKDIAEKALEEYDDVFSDIVNVLLFGGEQLVKEDELTEAAPLSVYKDDGGRLREQERDISKFWKDGRIRICLYGLENQTDIDVDMPLRVISYGPTAVGPATGRSCSRTATTGTTRGTSCAIPW